MNSPVLETTAALQKQTIELVKQGQDAVLRSLQTFSGAIAPLTSSLTDLPLPKLPTLVDPLTATEQTFDFAGQILNLQRDFARSLIGAAKADTVTTVAAPKTTKVQA